MRPHSPVGVCSASQGDGEQSVRRRRQDARLQEEPPAGHRGAAEEEDEAGGRAGLRLTAAKHKLEFGYEQFDQKIFVAEKRTVS